MGRMIRLRSTTVAAVVATIISALATACSGPGSQPTPVPPSCHPGVSSAENWIINSGELSAVRSASPSSVSYAVSPAHLLVLLVHAQTSSSGQEVADFRSYAQFSAMIRQGTIPPGVHWVLYDNERWSLTPAGEQADPVRYEQLFAELAHQHGYKVILAPAQDLVLVNDRNGFQDGSTPWQSYLSMGLATTSARYGDIYEIQAQRYEMSMYRSQHDYANFVAAAAAQARAANPDIVVYAGLSTQRVSGAGQLFEDYLATRDLVEGYWLNIPQSDQPGPAAIADQFFRNLPTSASADSAACGGI
jgi:hypothetical protein